MAELKHIIQSQQFDSGLLRKLFSSADFFRDKYLFTKPLVGKLLISLFYEPSTRTRLSFESAMIRLGGSVMGTEAAQMFSSVTKGETLEDTIRVLSGYGDVIVLRHGEEGAAKRAAEVSSVPIINGGDGKGQHPTQALLDVYTINREVGEIDGKTIVMVGDLASGRTVHSLSYLLSRCYTSEPPKLVYVSPSHLRMKSEILDHLKENRVPYEETEELAGALKKADVVYMTRIQKERMQPAEYDAAKGRFVIGPEQLNLMKPSARLMHPLPHVEEINLLIDTEQRDRRVAYFRQAENGLYVRMALLNYLLIGNGK